MWQRRGISLQGQEEKLLLLIRGIHPQARAQNTELRKAAFEEMRNAAASWEADMAVLLARAEKSDALNARLTEELRSTVERAKEDAEMSRSALERAEQLGAERIREAARAESLELESAALRSRCEEAERRESGMREQIEAQRRELAASREIRECLQELRGQVHLSVATSSLFLTGHC